MPAKQVLIKIIIGKLKNTEKNSLNATGVSDAFTFTPDRNPIVFNQYINGIKFEYKYKGVGN